MPYPVPGVGRRRLQTCFRAARSALFSIALGWAVLQPAPGLAEPREAGAGNLAATAGGNFVVGPEYRIDPDLTDRGNPKGKAFEFTMALADSEIFKGDDATLDPEKPIRKERRIFVYVPPA